MKILICILIILTNIGCNGIEGESITQNDRFELIPEPDKYLREKYEQQLKERLQKDAIDEEYLGERLIPIRANFKRINAIEEWTAIDKRVLKTTKEVGFATYYFIENILLKIIVVYDESNMMNNQTFYTEDGQLSTVLEKSHHANIGIVEDCSYFENGMLIRQENNQDCRAPFTNSYLKEEQIRLKTKFDKLKRLLEN